MAAKRTPEPAAPCPVETFARDVVAGKVVAGRLVRLACARHLRDLETGHARGLRFDREKAGRAIDFFGFLLLADGEFAGKPFELQPFQRFVVGSLFGWVGADGHRRFRTAYIEQGKGNGKSPLAAGVGLYGLVADGEAGAEVYSAATTRDQASILFRDAKLLAESSPALKHRLKIDKHNIAFEAANSFFRPVSSEHRGLDGKRPHVALIDEVHEHPSALVVDKMRAGTKNRRQALIFEITNSGHDRQSVCWHHHEYSRKILEGVLQDDSWFAYVCGLDPCAKHQGEGREFPDDTCPDCDHWTDEACWPKANPGLGHIIRPKYLREQVREAQGMPSKEGIVKRLNFCLWTEGVTAWLPAELWATGKRPVDAAALRGQRCWAGLDLSNRFDLNALVLVFRDEDAAPRAPAEGEPAAGLPKSTGRYTLLPFFWMPRGVVAERSQKDRVDYALWERQGFLRFTEGYVTDYGVVEAFIRDDLAGLYQIQEVAYDPYNATQMAVSLGTYGILMVEFSQNMRNYNEPSKEFEALLRCGRLTHGDHPVLNWQAGNVAVATDRNRNIRPVKPDDQAKKVDGVQAAVMGLARAMLAPDAPSISFL